MQPSIHPAAQESYGPGAPSLPGLPQASAHSCNEKDAFLILGLPGLGIQVQVQSNVEASVVEPGAWHSADGIPHSDVHKSDRMGGDRTHP